MGGLAGLVHLDGDSPDPSQVVAMADRLRHRGPDGAGQWSEGGASFAHRLRRVAPGRGEQPHVTDHVVLLLDGWLYDVDVLAEHLSIDPSRSAGDVVAAGWTCLGPDVVDKLEGEFALAVWDRRARVLTLLRDRIGVRPLYWCRQGSKFAFASELPALLQLPWVSRDLARDRLAEYLSFQVVHAPRTLLTDVHQVEPGHCLTVDRDGVCSRAYWRPTYAPPDTARPSDGEVVGHPAGGGEPRRGAQGSPRRTHRAVPLGGLGSTAIAAAAREQFLALPSYTIAFADDPFPELPFAGRVAALLNLEHHEIVVGTAALAAGFDATVAALGHPIGHPAAVLQMALAKAARADVRVVLSGDGSEALFGGRSLDGVARTLAAAKGFSRLPSLVRRPVARLLGRSGRGRRVSTPLDQYVLELGLGGRNLFSTDERAKLFHDHGLVRPRVRQEVLAPFYAGICTDPFNLALHGNFRSTLGEAGLPRADRTATASGLDVRFPLLDTQVIAAAAALPGSAKLRRVGGSVHTRWPLRAMLSGVIPTALVDRPKRGLPAPLGQWLAGPGRLFLEDRVQRLVRDPFDLWKPDTVHALRRDVTRSNAAGNRLWTLFILDEWLRSVAGAPTG